MKLVTARSISVWLCCAVAVQAQYDTQLVRPGNMPQITNLEVMCAKDRMTVQIGFSQPFQGLVFSKGQFNSPNCVYVKPYTSLGAYTFDIYFNKCGTKPDLNGKFYENTIIVQYDNELIEVWDEAKRLRCEWYNDYERTATKPPVVMADLEVIELNFRGDNVDCWMEIQDGKGPWASPVTGIVPIGSTLTMVVAINDPNAEFDMRVKSCEATDGKSLPIFLSDEHGCVLRPKMLSKFQKQRGSDGRASVLTYAHFHAFKFPDSMYVHLRCKVEICRHGCPRHCQRPAPAGGYGGHPLLAAGSEVDQVSSQPAQPDPRTAGTDTAAERADQQPADETTAPAPASVPAPAPAPAEKKVAPPAPTTRRQEAPPAPPRKPFSQRLDLGGLAQKLRDLVSSKVTISRSDTKQTVEELPDPNDRPVAAAQTGANPADDADDAADSKATSDAGLATNDGDRTKFPWGPRSLRVRRRRRFVLDESSRSADVGVTSTLEVLSVNDLQEAAGGADSQERGAAILQGRIVSGRSDVCLPAAGFAALFALLAVAAAVSVIVAGFLCRHRPQGKRCAPACRPGPLAAPMTGPPSMAGSMNGPPSMAGSMAGPPSMAGSMQGLVPARHWNMVGYIRQRLHVVF